MSRSIGITRFPGTNCDQDVFDAVASVGLKPVWLWHKDQAETKGLDAIVIPGGFSYGDYLRCGALAAKAPIMQSVRTFAEKGGPVLGICNGFQVLCEAGLLPGVLTRNSSRRFVDQWVELKLQSPCRKFGPDSVGVKAKLPVAHGEGCYYVEDAVAEKLFARGQVWWTYEEDINGSKSRIAGVMNESRNVAALMPHPERAMTSWMGGTDGRSFFTQLLGI